MNLSDYIKDTCQLVGWYNMSNISILKRVSFGIYCFISPTFDGRLTTDSWPNEIEETLYVGMTGTNNQHHYHYDRKNGKTFDPQGLLYMRMKAHKPNFVRENVDTPRENKYQIFYRKYGWGKEVAGKIKIGLIQPKLAITDNHLRAWLAHMESNIIYDYSQKFGSEPLMNLAHSNTLGQALINEHSLSQIKKREVAETSLLRHMHG